MGRRGRLLRPFCVQARVRPRGYSTLLQRALTDFGAEASFAQAGARLKEHYGLVVSASRARLCTLMHAQAASEAPPSVSARVPVETLVTELDGSLVPLVEPARPEPLREQPPTPSASAEGRRHQRRFWKEVRLCAAAPLGSRSPLYGATLGSVLEAGLVWESTARRAGLGAATRVHGVGDGAEWIAEQFDQHFGGQGRYLIDLYHVCEYLAAAAPTCAPADPDGWRQRQVERLKANRLEEVLAELGQHLEAETDHSRPVAGRAEEASATPVRDCQRYLSKRRAHLDYAGALARGWPIGSGLIEGGHRHVVQARLKKPGAWWREANARRMLALRLLRANGDWDAYWRTPHPQTN